MSYRTFDTHADEYDAWYDSTVGSTIFAMEVDCLKPLMHSLARPYLDVGVGSGRFARALGIEYGVDPASVLLNKARARGIKAQKASGGEAAVSKRDVRGYSGRSDSLLRP